MTRHIEFITNIYICSEESLQLVQNYNRNSLLFSPLGFSVLHQPPLEPPWFSFSFFSFFPRTTNKMPRISFWRNFRYFEWLHSWHQHATFGWPYNIFSNYQPEAFAMQLILCLVMLSSSISGIRAFTKTTSSRYVMSRLLSMRGWMPNLSQWMIIFFTFHHFTLHEDWHSLSLAIPKYS